MSRVWNVFAIRQWQSMWCECDARQNHSRSWIGSWKYLDHLVDCKHNQAGCDAWRNSQSRSLASSRVHCTERFFGCHSGAIEPSPRSCWKDKHPSHRICIAQSSSRWRTHRWCMECPKRTLGNLCRFNCKKSIFEISRCGWTSACWIQIDSHHCVPQSKNTSRQDCRSWSDAGLVMEYDRADWILLQKVGSIFCPTRKGAFRPSLAQCHSSHSWKNVKSRVGWVLYEIDRTLERPHEFVKEVPRMSWQLLCAQ